MDEPHAGDVWGSACRTGVGKPHPSWLGCARRPCGAPRAWGPINHAAFEIYVEQVLVPALGPGDVVILDNLSSHKAPPRASLIEAAGASLLYLPPYSPISTRCG
jgi:hypothetical protein